MIKTEIGTGSSCFATTLASSRVLRAVRSRALVTITTAIIFTTDAADARRSGIAIMHVHHHHEARESYSPAFSSIIVDGNSGATLSANNPDAQPPSRLAHQDHDALSAVRAPRRRQDEARYRNGSVRARLRAGSHQARPAARVKPSRSRTPSRALVTRSANDAAVVIAEAIAGDEDDFAKLMTRKARALGMTQAPSIATPPACPTTTRSPRRAIRSTLGARHPGSLPALLPLFRDHARSTIAATSIRNHNRLLGNVEGVDGIKTGYTRASGFNLVTSMRRGNRHLVGVVLGGRSGGSRDATMRNLLAENLEKGATTRTVAAITERNPVGRQCRRRRSRCRFTSDARRFRSRRRRRSPPRRAAGRRGAAVRTAPAATRMPCSPQRPPLPPQAKTERPGSKPKPSRARAA